MNAVDFRSLVCITIAGAVLFVVHGPAFCQTNDEDAVPAEQMPVQERQTGGRFVDKAAALPGKIITFPLVVAFWGSGKIAAVIEDNNLPLKVERKLTSEDGRRKVRPVFSPGGGGGLTFVQKGLLKDALRLTARVSFGKRGRHLFYGRLKDPHFFRPNFGLTFLGLHEVKPDEDFFGIGNDTAGENQAHYRSEETLLDLEILAVPFGQARFGAGITYSDINIENAPVAGVPGLDSLFSGQDVPGRQGSRMLTLNARYYRDTRDQIGHPRTGQEAYLAFERSQQIGGNRFGYHRLTIDLRKYLELFYRRVLALQFQTVLTEKIGGRAIPFYQLAGLGGVTNLRGYRPVRFRDQDLLMLAAEYRFPIHPSAVAYGFFQEGRVYQNIVDELPDFDKFKYSFGGGIRITSRDGGLTTVIELAKSKEQIRFILGLNTEFRRF
jgi:outer membrane protein assembly factor BamA